MCGFGVGLSWGVMSAHINTADIFPIIETDEYSQKALFIHRRICNEEFSKFS